MRLKKIIITLFESQIILAEHECCTNWGDCKSNKSNQIKCWFLRRGENRSSRRKTSRSRVENQQTQPTYDAGSGNRTRDTLVEGERSHHYTNPAPLKLWSIFVKDLISSNLFRRKLRTLDSICVTVRFGNVCLFRRYCLMFIVIDASV